MPSVLVPGRDFFREPFRVVDEGGAAALLFPVPERAAIAGPGEIAVDRLVAAADARRLLFLRWLHGLVDLVAGGGRQQRGGDEAGQQQARHEGGSHAGGSGFGFGGPEDDNKLRRGAG